MGKRRRVEAVLNGQRPDRTPVSFWLHFPEYDHDGDLLAEALIEFQRRWDLDFVKMMPSGMYGTEDYGCEAGEPNPDTGSKRLLSGPFKTVEDWANIKPVAPDKGARGRELHCLQQVRRALGPDVPIIQTVFSPSTTAAKMMGRDAFIAAAREHPEAMKAALEVLAESDVQFALASLDHGADGLFFATQLAGDGLFTEEEYRTFGVPYDLKILQAIASKAWFTMVHVHGSDPLYSVFVDYPVQAISWHDRRTSPSLAEAEKMSTKALSGGLDEWGILRSGTPAEVDADVRQIVKTVAPERLLLAPGCVLPLDVSDDNLDAVRSAVE